MLFNLAIRFPSALYVLEAFRTHIRYMRIGCMQSTLLPILMTMLIWNDLMDSQHDNLSRGSPRLMTSDRQILYPQSYTVIGGTELSLWRHCIVYPSISITG